MANDTWNHAAARVLVRPLVGTWVRPDHITAVRVATGAASLGLLAWATPAAILWAGVLWIVSGFLDRADGELARIAQLQSRRGHLFDYYSDVALNSLFFLAAGIAVRHGALHSWAVPVGLTACTAMLLCCLWSEVYEDTAGGGVRTWEGGWGFQPDDALYLLAPIMWLGWLTPVIVVAAACTSVMALVILVRLTGLRRRLAATAAHAAPG